MNINVQPNDELELRIVTRLAERQHKLDRMAEIERGWSRKGIYGTSIALLAAACVAALIVFKPWASQSPLDRYGIEPDVTEYRSASPEMAEVAELMTNREYTIALAKVRVMLEESDSNIKELEGIGFVMDDEELMYAEEEEMVENSELRWTYIYLLIRCNDNKAAKKQLKKYLKSKDYCFHREEAKKLYDEI